MKHVTILSLLLLTACGIDYGETITLTSIPGTYVGCYTDTTTRALPVNLLLTGATVEACIAIAQAQGYKYAGVQDGVQCFAGNALEYTHVPDNSCDIPCSADPREFCGGAWHNSVYLTGN